MKIFHIGLRRFCAVIIGLVFFTAGSLKLMDPVGASLVVDEYLKFFNMNWFLPAAAYIGTALALLETLCGIAMLSGVWRRFFGALTGCFTVFFTFITLILVIKKPVMDCGCFGEAIHLSHTATFIKNLILCVLCAVAFIPLKQEEPNRKTKLVAFWMISILASAFTVYSWNSIPMMDFTEFAPGASLAEDEESHSPDWGIDINGQQDSRMEYFVIYEKDGKEGAFTLDKLPDSTWTFVRTELIERNYADYEESIPLFYLSDREGEYRNEELLKGRILLLSVYDKEDFIKNRYDNSVQFIENAMAAGFKVITVSREMFDMDSNEVFTSDYKKIITMNRSNGGLTYISDGEIIRKWHANQLPDRKELDKLMKQNPMEVMVSKTSMGRIYFEGMGLYSLAVLLLL